MKDLEPTVRSRALGDLLRQARERAGYNGSRLARVLGWSPSRVSRLESGKRGACEASVANFLGFCGVGGDELGEVLTLCRNPYSRTWLRPHHEQEPDRFPALIAEESRASSIVEYEPLLIPSLLQTEDYARALFRHAGLTPEPLIEQRVRARMNRHALFQQRHQPRFTYFLSEQVVRCPIGDPQVVNDQLHYLTLVSSNPRCAIHIVPATAGPSGLLGEPFRLIEHATHNPVIYLRTQTASLFLEEPDDIAHYRTVLARLAEISLDEHHSRKLLVSLATGYDCPAVSPTDSSPTTPTGHSERAPA